MDPSSTYSQIAIAKADGPRRLVYCEVYSPLRVDTDKEAMIAREIEKTAHGFMLNDRLSKIDIKHNFKESGCKIVESFIARAGDPDFTPGSWVLGIKVFDDRIWSAIEKGELNGLSFGTTKPATRTPCVVSVSHPVSGAGSTEPCGAGLLPGHTHTVKVSFNDDSRIVPTFTGETLGHVHPLSKTTATDINLDHAHRLIFEGN